jgi:hypothetical protein
MKSQLLLALVILPVMSFSQLNSGFVFVKSEKRSVEVEDGSYVKAYVNNIPSPVMTSFNELFPNAENVSWFINNMDVTGYFTHGEKDIAIHYKKDGFLYSIRKSYTPVLLEKKLSDFLTDEISSNYKAQFVTEVVKSNETLFEISFTNNIEWLIVRVGKSKNEYFQLLEKTKFKKG